FRRVLFRSNPACPRSHAAVPTAEISLGIFGADHFRPLAQRAPITYRRRPRLGEDAVILDGEFKLQPLALVVWVAGKTGVSPEAGKPSLAAFFCFFRGFIIEQSIALHHVQSHAMPRAIHVEQRKRPA